MATEKEDGRRVKSTIHASIAKKMVKSQALGGHFNAHQEEIKSRGIWNYPGCSSNSIDITRTNPYPFLNSLPQYASPVSGNNLTQSGIATSPLDFNQKFSNKTILTNASKFPAVCLGNAKTQFIMSPNLSSGNPDTEFHHSNSLLPPKFAPPMSSTVFVSSGSTRTIGFSSDHSTFLGRDGACQFNTDEFQTWQDGFPSFPGDAIPKFQGYDLNKLPYTTCAMSSSGPGLGSNQFPGVKEPTSTAPFSLGPCPRSGHNDVTLRGKRHALTSEWGKRCKSGNAPGGVNIMTSLKKPKIVSNPSVETEKMKKFPPITDEKKLVSALGISVDAAQEGPSSMKEDEGHMDLDLSLHL